MQKTKAYAVMSADKPLTPFDITRREVGPRDVLIEIAFCGICHSDIHQARDEWNSAHYPMVPGHEIVGTVKDIGKEVTRFKRGDIAGVGPIVNSCRTCTACKQDLETYCENHIVYTYNSTEMDEKTPTYGGYSTSIVVDEDFVLHIDPKLPLDRVAPLLCAGITTYSPLKHWQVGPGSKVGIAGLGGLGHIAVKIARAMGAEVTVLSTSVEKRDSALALGATEFINVKEDTLPQRYFDFILSTISGQYPLDVYINMLKLDSTIVLVGAPEKSIAVNAHGLIDLRRSVAGSLIGGMAETQEMLDFCAHNKIFADIELIPVEKVNEAYNRILKGDVQYRFVIDMDSLRQAR